MFEIEDSESIELTDVPKPAIVYKYRNWKNETNVLHDQILLNQELYIPSPNSFEDVNDCRNPTRYDLLTDEERVVWCERCLRKQHRKFNDAAIKRLAKDYSSKPHLLDVNWIKKVEEESWIEYNQFSGVFCTTENPLNKNMWEKYGDSYKGICFGFDTNQIFEDMNFSSGGLVNYVVDLPIIHPLDEFPLVFFKRIFFKEMKWNFEEEYRFKISDYSIRSRKFRQSTLVELIVGHEMKKESLDEIVTILSSWTHKPKLFMTLSNAQDLQRIEIDYL